MPQISRKSARTNAGRISGFTAILCLFVAGIIFGGAPPAPLSDFPFPLAAAQTQANVSKSVGPAEAHQQASEIDWGVTLSNLEKVITSVGFVVGGVWAYIKFFRGRTFRPRLELQINGKIIRADLAEWLKVSVHLKNVGLSDVRLKREVTYVDVFLLGACVPAKEVYDAIWEPASTFLVFQEHGWIEPGETITDELLLQLPERKQSGCKLELTVNSPEKSWIQFKSRGCRWNSKTIIERTPAAPATDPESETPNERKEV